MNFGSQQQPNISIDKTTPIICEECENDTFVQALYLRKISPLLTGTGQEGVVPVPTFMCAKCNHVNEAYRLQILPDLDD